MIWLKRHLLVCGWACVIMLGMVVAYLVPDHVKGYAISAYTMLIIAASQSYRSDTDAKTAAIVNGNKVTYDLYLHYLNRRQIVFNAVRRLASLWPRPAFDSSAGTEEYESVVRQVTVDFKEAMLDSRFIFPATSGITEYIEELYRAHIFVQTCRSDRGEPEKYNKCIALLDNCIRVKSDINATCSLVELFSPYIKYELSHS